MALERKSQQTSNGQQKSDAFLNLELVDGNGNRHKIPRTTIGLIEARSKLERSLIQAELAEPGKEFHIVGTVNMAAVDDGENLAL